MVEVYLNISQCPRAWQQGKKVKLFKARAKRKLAEANVPRTHAISTNPHIQLFKEKYVTHTDCTSSEKIVYEYKSVNMYMVWVYYSTT